ncbi:hypothetical protein [Pseudomonas typographi]|uniref:hypothetical protein n=1 Tax=Pseudomonas typographi TaxID=2715964 RepID=UPI001684EC8D|nr:hypothetical protein [Pseudomonas typographi]MBD1555282.1 hypothetical protein [Pseudomonas typographi]
MSEFVEVTLLKESELPAYINQMDKATRDWTDQAARGECGWVCSDCCYSWPNGMPDQCEHGIQSCTDIIKRDKLRAMSSGNEPS